MKNDMKRALLLSLVLSVVPPVWANDSQYLIHEMESLRDSLKSDDPARMDLTVRLADLYFDVSIQEASSEGNKNDLEIAKKNRLKALDLYRQSLAKQNNSKKSNDKISELSRIKIQFQMARLLTRLDEQKMAEAYYFEVINNKNSPKKFIEQSALSLAEWYEDDARYVEAKKFYDQAISNCEDLNSCNYANYRKAWLLYKDTKLDDAIISMEKSLWSKEGTVRENSLTDLILFMSNSDTDGQKELEKIKALALKTKRPELLRQLVEGFYVAGNRLAGSTLLVELNNTEPNLYYEVRLLEEFYGFRKWDKVEKYISILEKRKVTDIPKKAEESKEVLAILRRFVVQVDAEMQVVENLSVFLKRSIDVYLNLYPNDELRGKMQAGWLSAETDPNKKIAKLSKWIAEDVSFNTNPTEIRKLRQTRLALAQGQKNSKAMLEESLALSNLLKGTKEADEFTYVAAREYYAEKNYAAALPLFNEVLAQAKATKEVSNWAVLSQNLVLDIYNVQKNYDGIIAQVASWKDLVSGVNQSEEIKKETKSIEQIMVQVQFLKAMEMKESPEALKSFTDICLSGNYTEKSCANAKILAVKFKDQEKLVSVLEKMGDEASLTTEYELMGRFSDAAKLKEKLELNGKPILESYIKTALLYELDQNFSERDRVLNKMIDVLKSQKNIQPEFEKVVYLSLDEANLINERVLNLPWSINQKIKVAARLGVEKPSDVSQKILLSSRESLGPTWSRGVLSALEDEYNKTNKIKFYGAQSQVLFKKRTKSIEKFVSLSKPLLDGADLETRIYILHMLKMTYKNLANEILNTPIPEGLDEKTMAAVTTQISTLADPFDRANEDYDRLMQGQLATISDATMKEAISKNLSGEVKAYASFIKGEEKSKLASDDAVKELNKKLHADPEDRVALTQLKEFYTKKQSARLSAYYAGRVDSLKQVE